MVIFHSYVKLPEGRMRQVTAGRVFESCGPKNRGTISHDEVQLKQGLR